MWKEMSKMKRRGELAEIAFLHEAAKRGFKVAKPFGDTERYDFIVDNDLHCWKVQVKSTGNLNSKNVYHVNTGRRIDLRAVPYLASEIDFIAVYIFPEDTWYILPFDVIAGRVSLALYSAKQAKQGPSCAYLGAWDLLRL
jgi:PD-(D/E)XK endonuclease